MQSSFVVHLLALFSLVNAWYTFWRSRSYRLYHQDANLAPRTPSARRVPVHDSPIMQNPLHLLPSFLSRLTKPQPGNGGQMVWEIAVWDPFPVCLRVFVFFSPLHVLVIAMFLPYSSLDPRPSMTVIKTLLLCAVVSTQGYFLQTYFEQKYRDQAIISQQVGKEYDAKFVQPNVRRAPVRDVAVQYPTTPKWDGSKWNTPAEVMVSPRNYFSPRTFDTHPSLAYESQCHQSQPDSTLQPIRPSPAPTPYITAEASTGPSVADLSSPIRTAQHNKRQASPTKPQWPHQGLGDGGNLGVYSSAYSPLRKAASSNVLRGQMKESRARDGSPLKRSSVPAGGPFASRLKPGDGPGSRRESGYY